MGDVGVIIAPHQSNIHLRKGNSYTLCLKLFEHLNENS